MKRVILAVITIVSLIPFFLSLASSLHEPQVQSDLELSQTDLLLTASNFQPEGNNKKISLDLFVLGQDPYEAAKEQYKTAANELDQNLENLQENLAKLQTQAMAANQPKNLLINSSPREKMMAEMLSKETLNRQTLRLKLGLLYTALSQPQQALEEWQAIIDLPQLNADLIPLRDTAQSLIDLWQESSTWNEQRNEQAASLFQANLTGWFRDRALIRLYTLSQQKADLETLKRQEQQQARQALIKLIFLSLIPILGGSLGLGLLLALILQYFLKKEQSLLAQNADQPWQTPWNWEITWQVLALGFFFLGQIGLPLLLGLIQLDASQLTLRGKAFYVLGSYAAMTMGGVGVMYASLKAYFPLPQDWFKVQWRSKVWLWGIGGYLVALPIVVIISLLNQQLWQGQGGSNPLLFLALQAQDKVVLGIFFFTAAVMAPLFEETMFRGFLLTSLTRYLPVNGAIIVSSLLFAIAHLNFSEVLPLAGLGVILGIVYTRTRNLLAPMLVHGLWNSGTLISLFILGSSNQ